MNKIKIFAIAVLSTLSLYGATYDDTYSVVTTDNPVEKKCQQIYEW